MPIFHAMAHPPHPPIHPSLHIDGFASRNGVCVDVGGHMHHHGVEHVDVNISGCVPNPFVHQPPPPNNVIGFGHLGLSSTIIW